MVVSHLSTELAHHYLGSINWWELVKFCLNGHKFLTIYIGLVGRVSASNSEDQGSILDRVHTKDSKIVLDTSFFNTQDYKVRFKGKLEQTNIYIYIYIYIGTIKINYIKIIFLIIPSLLFIFIYIYIYIYIYAHCCMVDEYVDPTGVGNK